MAFFFHNLDDFERICYSMIYENMNVNDFENFIYKESNEHFFSDDDFLELISIKYSSKYARLQAISILEEHVDRGRLETFHILTLLEKSTNNDSQLGQYLIDFYYLYCNGYYFLRPLAFEYGLACIVTPSGFSKESWHELSNSEKQRLHNMFQPNLNQDLAEIEFWITTGRIQITGTQNKIGHWEYIDLRDINEKKGV